MAPLGSGRDHTNAQDEARSRSGSFHPAHTGQGQLQGHCGRGPKTLLLPLLDAQGGKDLPRLAPQQAQPPTAGGAPDVTPGALHTGRRQSGWATSFEHGILCHNAHEEAAEAFFYLLPCEVHGPGGSAPDRVCMGFVQTPGIPLPLALLFFRGGVTTQTEPRRRKDPSIGQRPSLPWPADSGRYRRPPSKFSTMWTSALSSFTAHTAIEASSDRATSNALQSSGRRA